MPNFAVAIRPYASIHAAPPNQPTIPDPLTLASAWLDSETAVKSALVPLQDQIEPSADAKAAMMSAVARVRTALKNTTNVRLPEPQTSVYVPIKNDTGTTVGHSVISSILDAEYQELEAAVHYPNSDSPPFTCAIYLNATAVRMP